MSSPEKRLLKAIWGDPEVMYDRRQSADRRTSWRGGRRQSDWPEESGQAQRASRSEGSAKRRKYSTH